MTNEEFQMTNQIRNLNVEGNGRLALCSDFGLRASFGFRHSGFVIFQPSPITYRLYE